MSAQAVVQSGTVTPGHVAVWTYAGIIADGGIALTANSPTITTPIINGGTISNATIVNAVLSGYSFNNPTVSGGTFTSPTITGGTLTSSTLTTPTLTGGTLNSISSTNYVYRSNSAANAGPYQDFTITPQMFGALGNGSHDDTTAIQAAINYAATFATGAVVYFPPGNYNITGTLAITTSGVTLRGDGQNATTLTFNNGSKDCITIQGTNTSSGQIYGNAVQGFYINHGTKTAGRTLYVAFAAYFTLRDVVVNNCWTGIEAYATNTVIYENVIIQGVTGGVNAWGLYWHGGTSAVLNSTALTLINVTVNCLYSGADGMWWDGYATTLNADQLTLLEVRYGLWIKNTAASSAYYPQFASVNNFNVDGASLNAMYAACGSQMFFSNSYIGNTSGATGQGGADTYAMILAPDTGNSYSRNWKFVNCEFGNSRYSAVYCQAYSASFVGCSFVSGSTTPSNTYYGIEIISPATNIQVESCNSNFYGQSNNWYAGVNVGSGTSYINVIGNNLYSSTTGRSVNWQNSDANSRCALNNGDPGYAALSNSLDPAPLMVPAALSATTGQTLTAAQMLGGVLVRYGTSAIFTDTTPTAAQLVASLQSPQVGKGVPLTLISADAYTMTLSAGSGVAFFGNTTTSTTFTIAPTTQRQFIVYFNNTTPGFEAVTIYG